MRIPAAEDASETEAAMAEHILQVEGLTARVEDKVILHEVGLTIKKGETHVLMGPNGTGKSTLGYAITGHPRYTVTSGSILFDEPEADESRLDKGKAILQTVYDDLGNR